MTNSNGSHRSNALELLLVVAGLVIIVTAAGWYFSSRGFVLYYGDAQAHLNISRSWTDSRNPGYDQIGTVWLPILHLICLPFAMKMNLWQTGLAGTIPVACCMVFSGTCLYLCAKEVHFSSTAALASLLCFALNPNVLYLATIPMTEIVFTAGFLLCFSALLRFKQTQRLLWIAVAVAASWWMSLTRYDGWFLIPFIAVLIASAADRHKVKIMLAIVALAGIGPLYWIAHNWWETGNALDFYNGPYSAAAIQGDQSYPGFHHWFQALQYYWEAGRLCSGTLLIVVGFVGLLTMIGRGRWMSVVFLSLTPLFYVWSIHSSKTPIHVPTLWPFSYYNTRYGIAAVVLFAFSVGSLVEYIPRPFRSFGLLLPLLTLLPWVLQSEPQNVICWKESQHNSEARRAWTRQAAAYLKGRYTPGDGVLVEFGDLTGIFSEAAIPLKETLHEGSHAIWFANTMPNGLVHQTKWAIAQEGDKLSQRLSEGRAFHVVEAIRVTGASQILIYERD